MSERTRRQSIATGLVLGFVLTAILVACSVDAPTPTLRYDRSPAAPTATSPTAQSDIPTTVAAAGEVTKALPTSPPPALPQSTQAPPLEVTVTVGLGDTEPLQPLFSQHGLSPDMKLQIAYVRRLDGSEVTSNTAPPGSTEVGLRVLSDTAYLVQAQTADGRNFWGVVPPVSQDTHVELDIWTTYEAGLIYASLAGSVPPGISVKDLKQKAAEAVRQDSDRLVKTVKRITENAILKGIDFSPVSEMSKETLRAFGGGMDPIRAIDTILSAPESDYTAYVYSSRFISPRASNNILMTQIDGKRWDYRVQGIEGIPAGYDQTVGSWEYAPHATNGGTSLVFASTRDCLQEPFPCPEKLLLFSIFTISIDAPPDAQPTRLTPADLTFVAQRPTWSWDEEKIAFFAGTPDTRLSEPSPFQIYVMNKDGSGRTQLTFDADPGIRNMHPKWSPDNRQIVYASNRTTGYFDIWIMNADGSENVNLTNTPDSDEVAPGFSPDGRQIAFSSDRDGDSEIFVMDRSGRNPRQLTYNTTPDDDPSWAHNGLEIVYVSGEKYRNARLFGLSTITGEIIFEFGDFALAPSYDAPAWAATQHVLIPSERAILTSALAQGGYLKLSDVLAQNRAVGANPPPQKAYEIKKAPKSGSSSYHREIYQAVPNYSPPPINWFPTLGEFGYSR